MVGTRHHRYLDAMGIQLWRLRDHAHEPPVAGARLSREEGVTLVESAQREEVPEVRVNASRSDLTVTSAQGPVSSCPVLASSAAMRAPDASPADKSGGASSALDWESLRSAVTACRACPLCETRTQTVFGVGSTDAQLMIIGEAPGADEDRQGEPFVGRAGQLLNRMLVAIGLQRDEVYIANILKCRPPGNRNPHREEATACRAFLMRQIALVQPQVILSAGGVSAHNLLDTDEAVGRLRGRWFELGAQSVPLAVTYHPSYLLRSPEQKAKSWEDLQRVARRLRGS